MLKLSQIESVDHAGVVLRLEGQVLGPWVEELRKACAQALATGGSLTLELADVSFVDHKGLEQCRTLLRQHVVFARCSPFVAEQLKTIEEESCWLRTC